MQTRDLDIIIIGAGLAGLTVARGLMEAGKRCLLLEKSRGLGGRIATRRIDEWGLDHGASFLSDSQYFKDFLNLSQQKVLQNSHGHFLEGGMNQLPKALAADLEIHKNQRAQIITPEASRWRIRTEEGLDLLADKVVITAPLPQAVLLLEENNLKVPEELKSIQYKKALIFLAILNHIPEGMESFCYKEHNIYLMKQRRLHPRGVVMHLSNEASEEYFEKSDEAILQLMHEVIKSTGLKDCEIEKSELKKWRYSRPHHLYCQPYAEVLPGLYLTGDAFSGAISSTNNLVQVLRT